MSSNERSLTGMRFEIRIFTDGCWLVIAYRHLNRAFDDN